MFNKKEKCHLINFFTNIKDLNENLLTNQTQIPSINDSFNSNKIPKPNLYNLNTEEMKLEEDLFLHKVNLL